jgi:hypothetical protein
VDEFLHSALKKLVSLGGILHTGINVWIAIS